MVLVTPWAASTGPKSVDPKSVGMALMSVGSSFPFTYDPQTGSISLTIKEALKGTFQRALVWATEPEQAWVYTHLHRRRTIRLPILWERTLHQRQ